MKKLTALLMAFVMLFTFSITASAECEKKVCKPIVYVTISEENASFWYKMANEMEITAVRFEQLTEDDFQYVFTFDCKYVTLELAVSTNCSYGLRYMKESEKTPILDVIGWIPESEQYSEMFLWINGYENGDVAIIMTIPSLIPDVEKIIKK